MKVYVVVRNGPEWRDMIEGYFDKHQAEKVANAMEADRLKSKDLLEGLSNYVVESLVMKDKR